MLRGLVLLKLLCVVCCLQLLLLKFMLGGNRFLWGRHILGGIHGGDVVQCRLGAFYEINRKFE